MEDIIDRLYHGQLRPNENIGTAAKECSDKLQGSERQLTKTFTKEQAELYRELTIDQDIYIGMTNLEAFGWIDYEGGGGIGEVNEQMYQNGNKIGCFG